MYLGYWVIGCDSHFPRRVVGRGQGGGQHFLLCALIFRGILPQLKFCVRSLDVIGGQWVASFCVRVMMFELHGQTKWGLAQEGSNNLDSGGKDCGEVVQGWGPQPQVGVRPDIPMHHFLQAVQAVQDNVQVRPDFLSISVLLC